jgi:hypothetical protein
VVYFVAISVWHGVIVINSDICFITIVDSQGMPGSRMESFMRFADDDAAKT